MSSQRVEYGAFGRRVSDAEAGDIRAAADAVWTAADFKRGDRVRYVGPNAHYGMVGTVRGLDTWIPGEVKVDVDFHAAPGGRKIRKIVAPENLERVDGDLVKR